MTTIDYISCNYFLGISSVYAILLGATTWSHTASGVTAAQKEDRRYIVCDQGLFTCHKVFVSDEVSGNSSFSENRRDLNLLRYTSYAIYIDRDVQSVIICIRVLSCLWS